MFLTYSEDYSDLTNKIKSILETEGSELLKATGKTSDGFIAEFNKLMKMDDAELEGKFAEAASILYNFSNALSEEYAKGTISKAARLKFAAEEEGSENQEGNEGAEILRPTFWKKTKEKLPKSPSEAFKLGLRTYMPFGMADLVLSMLLSLTDSNAPKTYRVLVAAWTLYLLFPADFFIDFILVAGYIDEYLLLAGLIPILKLISKDTYTSNKEKVTKWLRGSSEEEVETVIDDVVEGAQDVENEEVVEDSVEEVVEDSVEGVEGKKEELSEDVAEQIASLQKKIEELKRKQEQQETRDELNREREKTENEVRVTSTEGDDIPFIPKGAPKKKRSKEKGVPGENFDKDIEKIRQKIDRDLATNTPVESKKNEQTRVTSTEELFINNIEAIEPCIKASAVLNTNPEAFNIMKNINLNISDYLSYIDQEEIDEEEKLNKLFKIFDLEYSNEIVYRDLMISSSQIRYIFDKNYYRDLNKCSDDIKNIIKELREKYYELEKAASEILRAQSKEIYSESGGPASQPELQDDFQEVDLEDSEEEVTQDDQAQFEDKVPEGNQAQFEGSDNNKQQASKNKKKINESKTKQTSDKETIADNSKTQPVSEEDEVVIPIVDDQVSSTRQTHKENPKGNPFSSENVIIQDTSEEEKEKEKEDLYKSLKIALTCDFFTKKVSTTRRQLENKLESLNKYYFEIKDMSFKDKNDKATSKDKEFLKLLLGAYSHRTLPKPETIEKRYKDLNKLISCLETKAPETYDKFHTFIFEVNRLLSFYHQTEKTQTSEKVDVPKESPQKQEVAQVDNIDDFIDSCFGEFDSNKEDLRAYIKNFDTFSKQTLEEFDGVIKYKRQNEEAAYSALFNNGNFVHTLFKTLTIKFPYEEGKDLVYPKNDYVNGRIRSIEELINRCDKEELKNFKEGLLSRLEKVRSIYTVLFLKHEDFKKKKEEAVTTSSEEESEDDISEDYTEILMQQAPTSSFTDYIIRTPVENVDTKSIVNVDEKPVVNKNIPSETNTTFSESDEEYSNDILKRAPHMQEPFRLINKIRCPGISVSTYQQLYNNFFTYKEYIEKYSNIFDNFNEERILNDETKQKDHDNKLIRDQSRNLLYKCFTPLSGKVNKPADLTLKIFEGYIDNLEKSCKPTAKRVVSFYKKFYDISLKSLGKIED